MTRFSGSNGNPASVTRSGASRPGESGSKLGLRMGRIFHAAHGGAVAILGLSGLLFSCTTLGLTPAREAQGGPAATASHKISVADNFDAPDLEKQFELIARRVAPAVVAISGTEARIDAPDAL